MQPVNVLPVFVSQDTDLKNKNTSSFSEEGDNNNSFSRLVDQHVTDEKEINARQHLAEAKMENKRKDLAAEGEHQVDNVNNRQENDSTSLEVTQDTSKESLTLEALLSDEEVNAEEGEVLTDALSESELFISMLYNSDKTLNNSSDIVKQGEETKADQNVNRDQVNFVNNAVVGKIDANAKGIDNATDGGTDIKEGKKITVVNDHKLSAFSKEELLARQQLKDKALVQQPVDQILKDYQQSLQSQQSTAETEKTNSVPLSIAQMKNNNVTDLAAVISQANQNNVTKTVDSGLSQLSVEPIGKEKVFTNDMLASIKDVVAQGKVNSHLVNEQLDETSTDVLEKLSDKPLDKKSTIANNKENNGELKLDVTKMIRENLSDERSSLTKISVEGNVSSTPTQSISQLRRQALANAQHAPSVNNEKSIVDDTGEEYDYSDALNDLENNIKKTPIKLVSTLTDHISSRSMSDVQAETIHATQTKQNNDAYVEHQTSEALHHNITSDIAQIQKNNVQLHQETIAIFRKDFSDAVKDKVMVMINQKLQRFDITLDPPELGNMQVRVNLQGEQASVNFVVQNQQAKEALDQNMHKLREMLSEQGVDVGGANVEQQSQQQSNDEDNVNNSNNTALLGSKAEDEHNVEHTLSTTLLGSSAKGVDYYA
jgi:flagellar hook-length control protein FliK